MLLATWNVNSIRARIDRVIDFLERHNIDVLAIQETKCKDEQFPVERFIPLGYEVAHWGINQWNGIAIISRIGLTDISYGFAGQPGFSKEDGCIPHSPEPRALGASCGDLRVWSIYVPNGRELADPHFTYKINWLNQLYHFMQSEILRYPELAICGDWNIAPEDTDVWDIHEFDGKTHVTHEERNCYQRFVHTDFFDPVREHTPGEFTYWDYTQLRFQKREGMRIDFALLSSNLAAKPTKGFIDREERKGKGASDHAPVIVEIMDI